MCDMNVSQVARFLASGGMAEEDAEVVHELLVLGKRMATLVGDDAAAAPELKSVAGEFLQRLSEDTYSKY